MTPEREKYLAKCGEREKFLRAKIKDEKKTIRDNKRAIQTLPRIHNLDLERASKWVCEYKRSIAKAKIMLTAYRHELSKVKGVDKVVPRMAYIGVWGDKGGLCKCGKHITDVYNYCPWCGKLLLWEV